MKGHIRERSPGHWAIVIDDRDPETGKRKRKWHSFRGTKREAQAECARLITERKSGTYVDPSKLTLGKFFEIWLEHIKANVEARTHERYGDLAMKNLKPLLGGVLLSNLQPVQISRAYAKAIESGRRDGKGGLSPRTVHHMHRVLFQALEQAERWKMIARNPAALLEKKDRPKVPRKTVTTIDANATAAAIEAARTEGLLIPILLGSMCGLRRGEITALRWKSLNLEQGALAVIASTEQTDAGTVKEKMAKSDKARTVALPSLVVDELRRWRTEQAQQLLRLGVRPDADTHVLTDPDGSLVRPRTLTRRVSAFLKAHGHRVTLHGLRHSHASHLLTSKVHPKVVQERFGHSSIAVTMDIYSHLMPNIQGEAAGAVDDVMRAAIAKHAASEK